MGHHPFTIVGVHGTPTKASYLVVGAVLSQMLTRVTVFLQAEVLCCLSCNEDALNADFVDVCSTRVYPSDGAVQRSVLRMITSCPCGLPDHQDSALVC